MVATCVLAMECGETSPQDAVHVALLTGHVGRRGRAISLFTEISLNSSLGGLCIGPEHVELRWSDISVYVRQVNSGVESRLMGHAGGPQVCVY